MINQRLFDHYGIDTTKDLGIGNRCPRPFDTILIDKRGSCFACECQSWLPQSVGNLQVKELSQIIGNATHQHLQSSIEDGTYRYCNEHQCSYIKSESVMHDRSEHIRHLRLAIDDSCNLRCPSCRKGMIFHKEGPSYDLGIRLANKINDWLHGLKHPVQVHLGSDGDPFASYVYRHFMEQTPRRDDIEYSILTNGLMFKDFYHRVPHIINNLRELGVSIDGASQETYEKLRLGGKWDKIIENLECMSEIRTRNNFRFILHFVVQKENYHEMEEIMTMGRKYNADRVWLSKINDWNTFTDFSEHNIFDPAHPLHKDFKEKLDNLEKRVGTSVNGILESATLRQLH